MKRWSMLVVILAAVAIIAAGCGGGGDANSKGDGGGGEVPGVTMSQTEATACAANRSAVSSAAQAYYSVEGAYPASIQALVPGYLQSVPACPAGGRYTLQGSAVTCSIHGD